MNKFLLLSFFFSFFCLSGKCSEVIIHTKFFQFEYGKTNQIYCVDYILDKTSDFSQVKLMDIGPIGNSLVLPESINSWFLFFMNMEYASKNRREDFIETDTINLSKGGLIREMDFNVDGTNDLGFLNQEKSGATNAVHDIYLNLKNQWTRWYNAPSPILDNDVAGRTLMSGWHMSRDEGGRANYKLSMDTNLQLVYYWETKRDNKTNKLVRIDSILQNDSWKVEIDSNFTFDN